MLNVELTQFSSAAELSSGLESGKLDVAFIGSVPILTFQSQGHDLTIFGGAMSNGHGYVIKSEYTEGLSDWDISILKGRNVASVKNSVQDAALQILLKNAGIEIGEGDDQVNIVYFDSQKDAYAALQNQTEEDYIRTEVYGGYAASSPDPDKQGTVTLKDTIVDLGYTDDYDIDGLYNTDIYQNALSELLSENAGDAVYQSLQEHFDQYE